MFSCVSTTGGRDRRGGAIIIIELDDKYELNALELGKCLLYLSTIPE